MAPYIHASIIIVNWNTKEFLKLCLDSIYCNFPNIKDYQIIVVDNNSTDGSVRMLEDCYPDIDLIKNNQNVGFGAAVNQAQLLCNGEYILLLNSDAQLLDDGVTNLINILNHDHKIAAITGIMQDENSRPAPSYSSFPTYAQLLKSFSFDLIKKIGLGVKGRDRGISRSIAGFNVFDVDWVSGGYMLLRNEALGGQPIFDENIFMYYEDTLLCHRLWIKGYRVAHSPVAPVLHEQGGSAKKIKHITLRHSVESCRIYINEVYGVKSLQTYNAITSLLWRIFSLIFGALSLFGIKKCREKAVLFNALLSKASKT